MQMVNSCSILNLNVKPHTKYSLWPNNPEATFHMYFTCEHTVVKCQDSSSNSEFAVRTIRLLLSLLRLVDQVFDCVLGQVPGALVLNMHHFPVEFDSVHSCSWGLYGCFWVSEWVCCCSALNVNGTEGRGRGCSHSQSLARMSKWCHEEMVGGWVPAITHLYFWAIIIVNVMFGRLHACMPAFLIVFVPHLFRLTVCQLTKNRGDSLWKYVSLLLSPVSL